MVPAAASGAAVSTAAPAACEQNLVPAIDGPDELQRFAALELSDDLGVGNRPSPDVDRIVDAVSRYHGIGRCGQRHQHQHQPGQNFHERLLIRIRLW